MLLIGRLPVLPHAIRLTRLVKGLEEEQIHAPVEHATDAGLPELTQVVGRSLCRPIGGAAIAGPAGLAVHHVHAVDAVGRFLDVAEGLHHVVEVRGGAVFDWLGLPEGEGVCEPGLC